MYVLDSDVLTVISGSRRNQNVTTWYNGIDETDIYLSVFTIFEQSKNAETITKKGKKPEAALAEATLADLKANFAGRILLLDTQAAEDWGRMIGRKNKHVNDAALAAIAKRNNFQVVTRNVDDYDGRGARLLNPFHSPPRSINP